MNHGHHKKESGFSNSRGLAVWFFFSVALLMALYAFGVFPVASAEAPAASQSQDPATLPAFKAMAGEHVSRAAAELGSIYSHRLVEEAIPPVAMASTRSSFLASWDSVSGAAGYRLDVSISSSFSSYVSGYQGLDVGSATNRIVSGLRPGTIYYYRVRAYNSLGTSSGSIVEYSHDGGDYFRACNQPNVRQFYPQRPKRGSNPVDDQPSHRDISGTV